MTQDIEPGQRFTRATVITLTMRKGRMAADCLCDCGKTYSTRPSNLREGISHGCRSCALKGKTGRRIDPKEKSIRQAHRNYIHGATVRRYCWEINSETFRGLIASPCYYCGLSPAKGIDRRDNSIGYTSENSVSCCKPCNHAKHTMSEYAFLTWVARIAAKQGFSL